VGNLLEGSVRNFGGRLRVAVQLTSTADGYLLWSASYDREMSDVFAVQDEIARSVVEAMHDALGPCRAGEPRRNPTSDVQAYDYYLRGRSFYYKFGRQDVEFALELFSRAIARDPDYALAHAGLADCWSYLYLYVEHTGERRLQAEAASRKAVELDPNSAQAHASRGLALSLGGADTEARAAFETAIRLDPALFEAHYFYARHAFASGAPGKAVELYEHAMELHPEDYQPPLLVAQIYDDLDRREEARLARERGVALALDRLELNPDDARAVYMAANGLASLGRRERAGELAARALAMRPDDSMLLYNVACVYALLGETAAALGCLERALECGLRQKGWLLHDNNLDSLRGDARFQDLVRQLG
jgi:tetratricopeptide (TPR) repeat protein